MVKISVRSLKHNTLESIDRVVAVDLDVRFGEGVLEGNIGNRSTAISARIHKTGTERSLWKAYLTHHAILVVFAAISMFVNGTGPKAELHSPEVR